MKTLCLFYFLLLGILPLNDNSCLEPEGLHFPREEAELVESFSVHTA